MKRQELSLRPGMKLESKYNGHLIIVDSVNPDGGVHITDIDGKRGSSTSAQYLERNYREAR